MRLEAILLFPSRGIIIPPPSVESGAVDVSGAPEDELARLDDSYARLESLVVNASWIEMLLVPLAVVVLGGGGRPNGGGGTDGDMGR